MSVLINAMSSSLEKNTGRYMEGTQLIVFDLMGWLIISSILLEELLRRLEKHKYGTRHTVFHKW